MKKESTFQILKKVIIGLVLSSLLAFVIYGASALLLVTVFYHDQAGERDFTPIYIVLVFIFQIAFWICYTRKTSDEFKVIRKDSFSWKEDFRETMRGEGKILVIVMTVLAVIYELSLILYEMHPGNPWLTITTALLFMFSLGSVTGLMKIVVLRTVLAYLVTTPLLILQIVWQHSRDFKKWNHG